MSTSTCPRLKSLSVKTHVNSFTSGLVGGYFKHFMFSQVDIFIEKPFSGNYYGKQLPLSSGSWGFVLESAKADRLTGNTLCKNKHGSLPQAIRFIAAAVRLRANVHAFNVAHQPYQARTCVGFMEDAVQGLVQRPVKLGLPLP
jgi:hypothetical protein